jgi:hypothetical protein
VNEPPSSREKELTFKKIVIAPFDRHIWHLDHFKLRIVRLAIEVLFQPLGLLDIPHCSTNIVPAGKQLFSDVASNEPIDASDEDSRIGLDHDSRHFGVFTQVYRGRG